MWRSIVLSFSFQLVFPGLNPDTTDTGLKCQKYEVCVCVYVCVYGCVCLYVCVCVCVCVWVGGWVGVGVSVSM
jgi:hypothetical protein